MTRSTLAVLAVLAIVASAGCSPPATQAAGPSSAAAPSDGKARLDAAIPGLLRTHGVAGAGIAVIRDGAIAWTAYYGEQSAGVATSARTVFNTASVAKTVTAEVLIALAAKGAISLDEPIYTYVSEPDLDADPRYRQLTPRLLLSHRSGLLNWRYAYEDRRLAFVHDPGTKFSYSGFGIELAARYAEAKLGKDFEQLAVEYLLQPRGIAEMSLGRWRPWLQGRLAAPMDDKGRFFEPEDPPYVRPTGDAAADNRWSGADDLLTTVDAYARLLIAVMDSSWLTPAQITERAAIATSLVDDPVWHCTPAPDVRCAGAYGHGLGWMVYQYDDRTVLKHGGNDRGENALVYYAPASRSGAVIFVNGGNGIFVTVAALDLIGDQPDIAAYYRQLVARHYKVTLPALRSSP